jgi:hypothetical protein
LSFETFMTRTAASAVPPLRSGSFDLAPTAASTSSTGDGWRKNFYDGRSSIALGPGLV